MLELQTAASEYFERIILLQISPEEDEHFQLETVCWLCENQYKT